MESRDLFIKGEIKRLKMLLDVIYDYSKTCYILEDEKKLKKIVKLLFEINEKVNLLKNLTKSYN